MLDLHHLSLSDLILVVTEHTLHVLEQRVRLDLHISDFNGLNPQAPLLHLALQMFLRLLAESLAVLDDVQDSVICDQAAHHR